MSCLTSGQLIWAFFGFSFTRCDKMNGSARWCRGGIWMYTHERKKGTSGSVIGVLAAKKWGQVRWEDTEERHLCLYVGSSAASQCRCHVQFTVAVLFTMASSPLHLLWFFELCCVSSSCFAKAPSPLGKRKAQQNDFYSHDSPWIVLVPLSNCMVDFS